jgi:hypothetical protein
MRSRGEREKAKGPTWDNSLSPLLSALVSGVLQFLFSACYASSVIALFSFVTYEPAAKENGAFLLSELSACVIVIPHACDIYVTFMAFGGRLWKLV